MNLNKFGRWSGIVVAVAMLAMVLQGCGGDDNGADQDLSDQLAMLQGELDAANAARMTADQAAADAMAAQTAAEAAQADAEMERDEANVARGAAETAKMVAEAAQADAEMAQAAADQAAADAMAAQMAADAARMTAETDRDNYKMMAEAAETARMAAETARMAAETAQTAAETARTAAETAQATAEMERDQANTAKTEADQAAADAMTAQTAAEDKAKMYKAELDKLRGDVDTGEMTMASEAAEALFKVLVDPADGSTLTAPMVSVDIEDGTLKAMAADYKMADAAPDMIEGWMGAMLVHADGHVAVVYSDRGTDGGKPLYDLYTFTAPADGKPRSYGVSNTDSTTQIDWDDVKRPDSTTTGGEEPGSSMFTGSVRGVPGSFSCPEDCDAPARHSDGTVNVPDNAGAWMFVPNDANAVIAGADSAYLTFGWWLQKDAGGMASAYRPIMSAPGMVAANAGDTSGSEIVGTATYTGGAAGKYALPSTEADTYEGGHFTAMATITADFDADNTADTAANDRAGIKLSGMIDNFMTGDVSRDWTVKLMADGDDTAMGAQPVDDLAADLDAASLTAEWSMGDSAATTMGTWDPTFYHEGTAPTDDMAPDAVTGTFEASGNIGRLRGAFGANME